MEMSTPIPLAFPRSAGDELQFPEQCSLFLSGHEAGEEVGQALAGTLEQILYSLALVGMDLRALDGITLSRDCRAAAMALQQMPEGQIPLEMSEQPDIMEMGRTVAVRRENELRFHIVLRAGLALMTLSPEQPQQKLAYACIAHEAAHVDHEGHLYQTFPGAYGCPLECGDRSRQTFLKAMDVWSEYAACRSSAMFRPEAVEEFEGIFCRSLEASFSVCKERIAAFREDRNIRVQVFEDIQQLFGDVFIRAGYFLGHLEGMQRKLAEDAPRVAALLRQYPQMEPLFLRLRRVLHELWLSESAWQSIEVFAPIYDLICEMMALHGLAFARHEEEWRMVMTDDEEAIPEMQDALAKLMARPGRMTTD
jgi:hypothetical protein